MWPFDQPRNCATYTTRQLMTQRRPITRVVHDASDHGWQLLSDDGANMEDAMLVGLKEIVAHDNTVLEIADLPPGWIATRDRIGSPWTRASPYADAARIVVDWSKIVRINAFYDLIFNQCKSPGWHGRILNAIADSRITGGINAKKPPYAFNFSSLKRTAPDLLQFRDAVLGIAQQSIDENRGLLETTDEQ